MTIEEVPVETRGRVGIISLNRPKALNALSLPMIVEIDAALARFADDPAVDAVVIRSLVERGFCSGGDVKALAEQKGSLSATEYFRSEYTLNYRIHTYPKPIIALMDGLTMGGGCGLSLHASHPVATERTVLAMPEGVLGLFPDVGATWFFGRLPDAFGLYAALTGLRLNAGDLMYLGLASLSVPSASLAAVIDRLAEEPALDRRRVSEILHTVQQAPETSALPARRDRISALFAGESIEAIRERLCDAPEDWADVARDAIDRGSPTTLKVIPRQFRDANTMTIGAALKIEYRLAVRIAAGHDFREGVRAILVDKDNRPSWSPAKLGDVTDEAVEALFGPLAEPELDLAYGF